MARFKKSDAWTDQRCNSCWLHWPGECPEPSGHERAGNHEGGAWGVGYQMVARFGLSEVRFECAEAAREVGTKPLCCAKEDLH